MCPFIDHLRSTDLYISVIINPSVQSTFYYFILTYIRKFRTAIGGTGSRLDIVLFGGVLGSLFSFLQFISSPWIGSLSDRYGRKNVLLISMVCLFSMGSVSCISMILKMQFGWN
jgi:MFS family permease